VPWIYIWVGVTLFGRCMHLYSHAFLHTVFFAQILILFKNTMSVILYARLKMVYVKEACAN